MPQPQHTETWYRRQLEAAGVALPRPGRHTLTWYQNQLQAAQAEAQRQAAQAQLQAEAQAAQKRKEYQAAQDAAQQAAQQQAAQQQAAEQAAQQQAAQQQAAQQQAAQQAAAEAARVEAARLEAERQRDQAHRRDEWDRLNKQGAYDPDGWQSIGHQPMPIPIPEWWLTGPTAPPAPPATHTSPPATNALTQAFGPSGAQSSTTGGTGTNQDQAGPQSSTQAPAGNWGAWGNAPNWGSTTQNQDQDPTGRAGALLWGGTGRTSWTPPNRQRNRTGTSWGSWGQNRTYRDVGPLGGTGTNQNQPMSWGTRSL